MLESVYLTKSKVRARLLGVLFSNPGKAYYLSELARLVKASAGNVQREIERFTRDGLIEREKKGSLVFYQVNPRHALFPEIRSLILKTVGIEGELRELMTKNKAIILALLYGSFARDEEKGESDIDLLIVSDQKMESFYLLLAKLESRFHREINPVIYSSQEFKRKISTKDSFVMNVLKQPRRILKGNPDEFKTAAA